MRLTYEEALQVGMSKLKLNKALMDKSMEVAIDMQKKNDIHNRKDDLPVMMLIVSIMGVSKIDDFSPDGMAREMTDAIELVRMAETEWRTERNYGRTGLHLN